LAISVSDPGANECIGTGLETLQQAIRDSNGGVADMQSAVATVQRKITLLDDAAQHANGVYTTHEKRMRVLEETNLSYAR